MADMGGRKGVGSLAQRRPEIDRALGSPRRGMCSSVDVPFVLPCSFLSSSRWPPRLQPRPALPSSVWAAFRLHPPLAPCPSPVLPPHHLVLLLTLVSPVVGPALLLSRLARPQDSSRHGQQRVWESGHSGRASSLIIGPVLMSNTFNSHQHSNPASLRSSRRCCPCWETRATATTARSFLTSLCSPPFQNRTIGVRVRGGGEKSPFVFKKQLFL